MNTTTYQKIKCSVPYIEKFLEADIQSQEWMFNLLGRAYKTSILILDIIHDKPLSYREISISLNLSMETVKQIIQALEEGGMVLKVNSRKWQTINGKRSRIKCQVDIENNLIR